MEKAVTNLAIPQYQAKSSRITIPNIMEIRHIETAASLFLFLFPFENMITHPQTQHRQQNLILSCLISF